MKKTYYQLLGVPMHVKAETILRKYNEIINSIGKSDKELEDAIKVLLNDKKRDEYDKKIFRQKRKTYSNKSIIKASSFVAATIIFSSQFISLANEGTTFNINKESIGERYTTCQTYSLLTSSNKMLKSNNTVFFKLPDIENDYHYYDFFKEFNKCLSNNKDIGLIVSVSNSQEYNAGKTFNSIIKRLNSYVSSQNRINKCTIFIKSEDIDYTDEFSDIPIKEWINCFKETNIGFGLMLNEVSFYNLNDFCSENNIKTLVVSDNDFNNNGPDYLIRSSDYSGVILNRIMYPLIKEKPFIKTYQKNK